MIWILELELDTKLREKRRVKYKKEEDVLLLVNLKLINKLIQK